MHIPHRGASPSTRHGKGGPTSTNVELKSVARLAVSYSPTAVQPLAEVQSTPLRMLACAPEGLGVGWIDHEVPFQSSARLSAPLAPTAVHTLAEMHDTPERAVGAPPEGLGVVSMDHELPFHASARVSSSDELSM